jgi:hypothetical protein
MAFSPCLCCSARGTSGPASRFRRGFEALYQLIPLHCCARRPRALALGDVTAVRGLAILAVLASRSAVPCRTIAVGQARSRMMMVAWSYTLARRFQSDACRTLALITVAVHRTDIAFRHRQTRDRCCWYRRPICCRDNCPTTSLPFRGMVAVSGFLQRNSFFLPVTCYLFIL